MKKFKIPSIPSTTNKTIRFPNDLLEEIEKVITGTNCTFSAFVLEAVRVVIENLKETENTIDIKQKNNNSVKKDNS